ncbi:uncharacterized protein KY384_009214 [Bacidia gigantensis]|uniref:uncharacterized protein n=1 Tax=Bacidia gigantensis TaxID=2732470 RepID=UPI001D050ABD|nr:uncharacterized protein KY384_009214 [Bacidia gigantensis]KAG8525570.1 hypothetical protein KY384_009214 [Bacidia gigantensis]
MEHSHTEAGASTEENDVMVTSPAPIVPSAPYSPQSPTPSFASSSTAVATINGLECNPPQSRAQSTPAESLSKVATWRSSSFSRLVTNAKTLGGRGLSGGWFGVSFRRNKSAEDRAWVITITKAGRWLIYLHILFCMVSIFDFVTTIYSWKSNADNDAMMQKIMKTVSQSGSRFEGLDNEFTKWMNATKLRSAEEEARLVDEQNRWNALLKVFEGCGASQSRPNSTDRCDDLRQFFDSNPLPHPDKSPIAKRNIAQLDRIIRRVHLGERHHKDPNPGIGSAKFPTGYLALLVSIVVFSLFCYAFLGALCNRTRRFRFRAKSRREDNAEDEKAARDDNEDASVAITASGGEFLTTQGSLIRRNLRRFDQHAAAAKGSVQDLRDNEADLRVNEIDEDNEYGPLLAAAARSGSLATVQYVLSRKPDVQLRGGRYHNVLQAGAHSGNKSIIDHLLAAGARDTSTGGFYGTAANAAAEKASARMLQKLLDNYANKETVLNHPGGTHGRALIAAAARGDEEIIGLLLGNGARVNNANAAGTTALHQAAGNGHVKSMEVLLACDADVNSLSSVYGTPLHAACRNMHAEAAKSLLNRKVDVSIKDNREHTPLHEAAPANEGLDDIFLDILRLRPDLIDEADVDGVTALHHASISGNARIAKMLLDAGADCSIGDKYQAQPLFRAAGCGHAEIVELLLHTGNADPNATDCFGRAALHGPARTNDVRVHDLLIKANADVNIVGSDRKTPLHEACNMGRINNVELLLAHPSIKVNELDNDHSDGNGDNFDSCINRDIVTQFLSRTDVDVNVSNAIIVQEAARKGFQAEVETMLEKSKASIQMRGGKYGGVLQAAAISGNLQLISLLLKPVYYADVNVEGGEFGCPLAAAAAYGHVDIVRKLLEAGADPAVEAVGRYGSPMQSACRKIDETSKRREGRRWAAVEDQICGLLREYGGGGVEKKGRVEEKYRDWRWLLTSTGWDWVVPGEM